jgi:SAM-dependent methyltransferase
MTKQAEREYPLKVGPEHLFRKPYAEPRMLREFGAALGVLQAHQPRGAVLDLGCGPGWTSLFLARAGYEVVGVDISGRMIEIARARAEAEGSVATFAVQDMEELSLGRRDFDAVLLFDALHHCPGHVEVLRRACAHLRPGGHLLLLEPSWLHLYSPHARAVARTYGVTELGFSRRYLRRALGCAGFRRVRAYHDPGPTYRGLRGFLLANLRLWCGYVSCFPQVKQIVLAER